MSNIKGKVYTPSGTFWNSKGEGLDFQQALDENAKCGCGISCCERLIRIKDQVTDDTYTIQMINGELVIKNETTPGDDIVLPGDSGGVGGGVE